MAFSVVIPTWRRSDTLRGTLTRILALQPPPNEILVHVDARDDETVPMLGRHFPGVRVLQSNETKGPGGGRNKLAKAASHEWIVSFDDDSWPKDQHFLESVATIIEATDADMIACQIEEKGDPLSELSNEQEVYPSAAFVGCGCVFRRSSFLETGGYLPLRYAYGMEENDVAIKLTDQGSKIIHAPSLLVYHDCERESHHSNPNINAAQVTNTMLFAFLRYPLPYWPLGIAQLLNRILFCMKNRRFRGLVQGIFNIPRICLKYRSHRAPVSVETLKTFRALQLSEHHRNDTNRGG